MRHLTGKRSWQGLQQESVEGSPRGSALSDDSYVQLDEWPADVNLDVSTPPPSMPAASPPAADLGERLFAQRFCLKKQMFSSGACRLRVTTFSTLSLHVSERVHTLLHSAAGGGHQRYRLRCASPPSVTPYINPRHESPTRHTKRTSR